MHSMTMCMFTCGEVSLASSVDPEAEVEVEGAGLVARRRLCEYTLACTCDGRANMSAAYRQYTQIK